jgi:hypothetical protein
MTVAAAVALLAAAFEDVPLLLLKTWWILICSAKHVISREERTAPRQGFRKTRVQCHNACNAAGQE